MNIFAFEQFYMFKVCVTLTYDQKIIPAIRNLRFSLHTIRNCYAKYEHIPSIHQRGVCNMSSVTVFKSI